MQNQWNVISINSVPGTQNLVLRPCVGNTTRRNVKAAVPLPRLPASGPEKQGKKSGNMGTWEVRIVMYSGHITEFISMDEEIN